MLDVLLAVGAYILVVRWHLGGLTAQGDWYAELLPVVGLIWWILSLLVRRDVPYRLGALSAEVGETVVINVAGSILLLAFNLMMHELDVSRLVLVGFPALALAVSIVLRALLRAYLGLRRRQGRDVRRVLFAGPLKQCLELGQTLLRREAGLRAVGLLLPVGAQVPASSPLPVLGAYPDLQEVLHEQVVDQVAVAAALDDPGLRPLVEGAVREGKTVLWMMDAFGARLVGRPDGGRLVLLSPEPDPLGLAAKRILDVSVASLALLLTSPVLVLAALAIKLENPRAPVVFRQRRVGLNGRIFVCFKFRTMVPDAEARRQALLAQNEMDGPVFKIRHDPRITRVGRVLRKYSVDELLQLWNVLLGDMSLVGPRPPLPDEVRQYASEFRRRLAFRPGLTCLWQVSGRNNVDFRRWMELDLRYVDNWSLWLDLYILVRTIPTVLFGSGM